MSEPAEHNDERECIRLQKNVRRLTDKIQRQKDLETKLNETLHDLRVHQEELRAQNEDLISTQRELSQSQRKYRDLFDFAPIGYFLIESTTGTIVEANLTGANMIGRHRSILTGKPLFLFIAPEYRGIFDSHLREIRSGHSASVEVALINKNKKVLPVELFSVPVEDEQGKIAQCRIAATDITKRRQAEEARRESERRLDAIVNTIPDIVYRLDQNGMISFISQSIRRYGYAPDELIGKPMLTLVHPRDRSVAQHRIDERRAGTRSTSGLELRLMPKPPKTLPDSNSEKEDLFFLVNAEGLYAGNGDKGAGFIGTQGIAHDITNRKQSELNRLNLEAELHKIRKMEAIGTLAGGVAHDFNNLLMGIQGSIALMDEEASKEENDQNRERVRTIEECVARGRDLTQQLLGFAKRGKYNVKTIDINKIVGDTARLFGRTHKAIEIRQSLEPELQVAKADQGQLEQVLLNILINADQAMPESGSILIETRNVEPVAGQCRRLGLKQGRYVRIKIEDTGIGMEEGILGRIFEPFFTTKEMGRGTGLGLASSYGIIKNHGGAIDVESTPGQGSRFFLYLPALQGSVVPKHEPLQGTVTGKGTILLVDDEKIVLTVSCKMLEHLGYQVFSAGSGKEAEEIYLQRHQDIDLVILDMVMPVMSGFETYNRLKTINPHIKVLLSSGFSREGQAAEIIARDRQAFIQKPFTLSSLSQKVAAMLAALRALRTDTAPAAAER